MGLFSSFAFSVRFFVSFPCPELKFLQLDRHQLHSGYAYAMANSVYHRRDNCKRTLTFGIAELSYLYNLMTHGSSQFVLRSKPLQRVPILKTTQKAPTWKNQFFFVKKNLIPNCETLPDIWVLKDSI